MINGIEGIPGSGKSYEAVVYHVLPYLQKGRKVITNLPLVVDLFAAIDPAYGALIELRTRPSKVRGIWDADRVDEKGNGQAFEIFADSSKFSDPGEVTVFGHVWDYYTDWKHPETGQGPVFIIDESHVPLPTMGTDKQVIEWFKLHRHFNVDVLLMTQSFRDANQAIARLIAMLVICRKADILGKKGVYIRKVKSGYRGAVISTEQRPYKPEYFNLYKSHTQGNSVSESSASDVTPMVVKFRRLTIAFLDSWHIRFNLGVLAFSPVQKTSDMQWMKDLKNQKPVQPVQVTDPKPAMQAPVASPPVMPADAVPSPVMEVPEPYASKVLHLTGRISMGGKDIYTFAVSAANQRVATLDSRDLLAAGYKWEPLTDCAGTLRWRAKAIAVTCDAPAMAAGSQDKPLVLEVPSGGGAPVGSSRDMPRTVPMPHVSPHDPGLITQADITPGLRLKNPFYSSGS